MPVTHGYRLRVSLTRVSAGQGNRNVVVRGGVEPPTFRFSGWRALRRLTTTPTDHSRVYRPTFRTSRDHGRSTVPPWGMAVHIFVRHRRSQFLANRDSS